MGLWSHRPGTVMGQESHHCNALQGSTMRVFITGGSGLIGSAVVSELLANGHTVLALARSDSAAAALEAAGAETLRGGLADLDTLRAGADAADGVIHLAFSNDFSSPAAIMKAVAEE